MAQHIIAVLLSGGESSRFWPLKEKNCIPLVGKTFLAWHYEQLLALKLINVIVVTNAGNEAFLQSIPVPNGLQVSYVMQSGVGQGQAVLAFESKIGTAPLLILNASDYYSDSFLKSFIQHTKTFGQEMILGAVRVHRYFPGGYLKTNAKGNIEEIVEKPQKGKEPSDVVRIVADYFPSATMLVDAVKKYGSDPVAGYEMAINKLIQNGVVCKAEITPLATWKYLKYPWGVLSLMDEFFSHLSGQQIDKSVVIKENVVIEGPVVIEEGVKIFEGTKIVGPVYIGKNTIIGNNNIIRHSHIGAYVVTGFSTDITRSYIGDNCWFHTNYIGDSVTGNNVSMGSGTVCANLRLDDGEISSMVKGEKIDTGKNKLGAMIGNNVRIGVNTSIMPGIKIGQNSFIGAGIVVESDVEDGKFMFLKNGTLTTVDNTKQVAVSRDEFRKAL